MRGIMLMKKNDRNVGSKFTYCKPIADIIGSLDEVLTHFVIVTWDPRAVTRHGDSIYE